MATDFRGYATVFDGQNWTTPTQVDEPANLPRLLGLLSCVPSPSQPTPFCIGMNAYGSAYRFDSGQWSAEEIVSVRNSPGAVSCPTTTFCMAVEGQTGKAVAFDGKSWSESTITKERIRGGQLAVSCSSPQFCVSGDSVGQVFSYNGARWSSPTTISAGEMISGISCVSPTFCMAFDSQQQAFLYDGTAWRLSGRNLEGSGQRLTGISCTATTFCIVTGVVGSFSRFDGVQWSSPKSLYPPSPNWPAGLEALSCASSTFCLLLGTFGRVMRYDGSVWSIQPSVVNVASFVAASCGSENMCVGITQFRGVAYQFSKAGLTATAVLEDTRGLSSISCPAENLCLALSAEGHRAFVGK